MQRSTIAIGRLLLAVLAVAALLGVSLLVYVRANGMLLLSVQTGSMRPTIHTSDAVLVRRDFGTVRTGDIISYRSLRNQAVIVTHRVIAVDAATNQITTKGDALAAADPPIDATMVVGRVERLVPYAGLGLDALRHPAGLAVAVYAPALLLAGSEIRRLMRHYQSQHYRLYAYPW